MIRKRLRVNKLSCWYDPRILIFPTCIGREKLFVKSGISQPCYNPHQIMNRTSLSPRKKVGAFCAGQSPQLVWRCLLSGAISLPVLSSLQRHHRTRGSDSTPISNSIFPVGNHHINASEVCCVDMLFVTFVIQP
jgi:hypothetical protein